MKYWLLTSEFPPLYGGGISTYSVETARMFSAKGDEVTVFTQNFSIDKIQIKSYDSYKVIYFNPNTYYTKGFLGYEANLSYAFSQAVMEIIQKEGSPDIIESQEYMGIAYYLLQFKCLQYPTFKDLKVVITLHAPSFLYLEYNKVPYYKLPYFWIGEMERFCIRAADLLISPSQYLINEIKSKVDISDKTIHVIKNPYQNSKENTFPNNGEKITFFGKLTPQKGCLEVINYFKELWDEGFEQSLIMIGGGEHQYHVEGTDMIDFIKSTYKDEIKSKKLILLGNISPDKVEKYLHDTKIVLVPSVVENFPYTVLEAMSRGKIVLASVQGGHSEIIDNNVNGFLFDHFEKKSFSLQLKQILTLNNLQLEEISKNAINKIKDKCSYNNIYEQKNELLTKFIIDFKEQKLLPFIRNNEINVNTNDFTEKNDALLSIVVPYFNMGEYVEETIESIINSTYKNIEIIIVNDGSTNESSIEKINELAKKHKIKIINKVNEGLSNARNDGAKAAKGDYLAFIDPDDTIEPEYFEKALNILKNFKNVSFVGCWAKYFGNASGYWPAFNPEPPYILFHNMLNSSALIYKKDSFLHSGLNDARMIYGMEDYESVINMLSNGYNGVVLPEPLWNYRIRKNSMARNFTKNKQLYLYKLISEKHKNYFSKFAPELINLINHNGVGFEFDNPTQIYDLNGNILFKFIKNNYLFHKLKSNKKLRKIVFKLKLLRNK
ncbi:MAG: glycosyltransferase [Bacteroidetes bacterium]|nr:glycosyltransferase [Bacteroidota bacterium]